MKKRILSIILCTLMLIGMLAANATTVSAATATARSYAVNGNVFLGNDKMEFGINEYGSFGSTVSAPDGFHPWRGTTYIGLVSAPWNAYNDYFLPGIVDEGFVFYWNGAQQALVKSNGRGSVTQTSYSCSGTVNHSSDDILSATTSGTANSSLAYTQNVSFKADEGFATMTVTLENISSSTLSGVEFVRGFDPDQGTGSASTSNYFHIDADGTVWIVATPTSKSGTYTDVFTFANDITAPFIFAAPKSNDYTVVPVWQVVGWSKYSSFYNVTAGSSDYSLNNSRYADNGIGLKFKCGDIAPGDSVTITYFMSLDTDVSNAFDAISGAVSGSGINAATGNVTLSLSKKATSIVVIVDGNPLTEGVDYSITDKDTRSPVISFHANAGLTAKSVITVQVTLDGESAPQTVTVPNNIPALVFFNITVAPGITNGTLEVDKAKAAKGETVTLTVTPNFGYAIDTVKYNDGVNDIVVSGSAGAYTFTMPEKAVTVSATFKPLPLSGTLSVSTVTGTYKVGDILTATIANTNNTGTLIYTWYRNGVQIPGAAANTYVVTADDVELFVHCVVSSTVQTGALTSNAVGPVPLMIFAPGEIMASGYNGRYDGAAHGIAVTAPAGATVSYSIDGVSYGTTAPTFTNVGNYTVYYRVEKAKYASVNAEASVSITQASPQIVWPTATAYVNDASVTLIGGTAVGVNQEPIIGTFTIEEVDLSSAGTKTTAILFVPQNTNYATIAKTDYSVTVIRRTVASVVDQIAITDKEFETEQALLGLPVAVTITTLDGKDFVVGVEWTGYNKSTLDPQTLIGYLDLRAISGEVEQADPAITASILVDLKEKTVEAFTFPDKTVTYNGEAVVHEISGAPEGIDSITYIYAGINGTEYAASSTPPMQAGEYEVTASFVVKYGYYPVDDKVSTLTVEQKEIVLVWSTLSAEELIYSATAKTLSATADSLVAGDVCTVTVEPVGDNVNVGSFTYQAIALSNPNYRLPAEVSSPVYSITPKALTVTARSYEIYLGDRAPVFGYTVSGFVGGDTFITEPSFTTNAMIIVAGTCDIVPGGADAGANYTITYVKGTLTIHALPLLVPTYDITVDGGISGGVVLASNKIALHNQLITLVITPAEGNVLSALTVTDKRGNAVDVMAVNDKEYTFRAPAADVVIRAEFAPADTSCPKDATCPMNGFTDLVSTEWYHDGVHFCLENGLMQGVASDTFAPAGELTRAMVATILWRLEGKPTVTSDAELLDVAKDEWYSDAMQWASANHILMGYGEGIYRPEESITREQLATMLYRYEQSKGGGFVGAWMIRMDFADLAEVSDWAYEALCWMNMKSVVTGKPGKLLDPKGNCTRAEAATMIARYCEVAGK